MRQVAQRSILFQDALPSQAEGGFAGNLSSSVMRALRAWEKRRFGKDQSYSWSKTINTEVGRRRKSNKAKKPLTPEQRLKKAAWAKANPAVGPARDRNRQKCREWHAKKKLTLAA